MLYIHDIKNKDFSFVKLSVLPSQRQGKKETPYGVWIAIHKHGWILSENCTCMAG